MKLFKEKYKLYLCWNRIEYLNDGVIDLKGAYFSGPALKQAAEIEAPDSIDLDLTPQLLALFNSYYIIRLEWDAVEYNKEGNVVLKGARLVNNSLKHLHRLSDSDRILINTEDHEEDVHAYNLVYESQVIREDSKPYNYEETNG